MSWVAIVIDPSDNKVEIVWFLLKKNSLWYSLRRSVFVYIS